MRYARLFVAVAMCLSAVPAYAQDVVEPEGLPRVGFLVLESKQKLVETADNLTEVMLAEFSSHDAFYSTGGEELRTMTAPNKSRLEQVKSIGADLDSRTRMATRMIDLGLMYWMVGYLGGSKKRGLRLKLFLYNASGEQVTEQSIGAESKVLQDGMLAASQKAAAQMVSKVLIYINLSVPNGAVVTLNDKVVDATKPVVLAKRGVYQIKVSIPDHQPLERVLELGPGDVARVQAKIEEFKLWISKEAIDLREAGLRYYRLKPSNLDAARKKLVEATNKGGKHDPKTWYYLAVIHGKLFNIGLATAAAQRAVESPLEGSSFVKKARQLRDKLNDRYGGVLLQSIPNAPREKGYVYVQAATRLIAKDKKALFEKLRNQLAHTALDLSQKGEKSALYYFPPGEYLANGVPFKIEPGKVIATRVLLDAVPRSQQEDDVPLTAWVMGGTGIAVIATGVVVHVLAFGHVDDYENPKSQKAAFEAHDKAESLQGTATLLYLTGAGVLSAVGVYYWLAGMDQEQTAAPLLLPLPGGMSAGVSVGF